MLSDYRPISTGSYHYGAGKGFDLKNRYIHTTRYGWIDMKHFLTAAAVAAEYRQKHGDKTLAYNYANDMGFALEVKQLLFSDEKERKSAFSYEDLPSNDAGATFGAYYYNPNKGSLGEQIAYWLNNQGPSKPEEVLNFDRLADTDADVGPSHIHRNYAYKPFDLNKLQSNQKGRSTP